MGDCRVWVRGVGCHGVNLEARGEGKICVREACLITTRACFSINGPEADASPKRGVAVLLRPPVGITDESLGSKPDFPAPHLRPRFLFLPPTVTVRGGIEGAGEAE